MKKRISYFRAGRYKCALACIIMVITLFGAANSQVVIVTNKLRAQRSAGKIKPRPRNLPQTIPAPAVASLPMPETTPASLSFAVFSPLLNNSAGEDIEKISAPVIWPELLGFEFEVVKADLHGHGRERRKERARFYLEGLSGGVNLEMIEVPAGMFQMGSTRAQLEQVESNYSRNLTKEARLELHTQLQAETPQHLVKVTAFYLSKYEVTQAQWRAIAGLPKVNRELMSDPSFFKGGNRPVEQISWDDAMEFCERLSRATGRRYRLPTEAEWEYASRAGTHWPFSFGETMSPELVNYNGKLPFGQASRDLFRQQTVAAGSLGLANAFGLYDLHGNVWEWCLDTWHGNYLNAPADSSSWEKDGAAGFRILRGGAWDSPAGECRSSGRRQSLYSVRENNIGFRIVAEMETILVAK